MNMKRVLYPIIFLLALVHKAMGLEWFLLVAAIFFAYTFGNIFARAGGCYRCKSQLLASIMLLAIAMGIFWAPLFATSGLLLGLAAFT